MRLISGESKNARIGLNEEDWMVFFTIENQVCDTPVTIHQDECIKIFTNTLNRCIESGPATAGGIYETPCGLNAFQPGPVNLGSQSTKDALDLPERDNAINASESISEVQESQDSQDLTRLQCFDNGAKKTYVNALDCAQYFCAYIDSSPILKVSQVQISI